jgi:hypothetical protein
MRSTANNAIAALMTQQIKAQSERGNMRTTPRSSMRQAADASIARRQIAPIRILEMVGVQIVGRGDDLEGRPTRT